MQRAESRSDATIAAILLEAERQAGERPGLYVGQHVLTFRQIADRSRQMAGYLANRGVRRGDRVALLLPNGVAFVTAHYALALLGAVIVPINPQIGAHFVSYVLEKAGALYLIGTEPLVRALPDCERMVGGRVTFVVVKEDGESLWLRQAWPRADRSWIALDQLAPLSAAPECAADDPALLFFTSGTTGRPKGVLLSQAQVLFGVDAWANRWSFDEETISLMAAPFFHVVYNPLVLGAHRRQGASVVQTDVSIRAVTVAVERYRVTALMGTPAFMRQLASERWAARNDLSSLGRIIYGAAPTPPAVVRSLGEQFPRAARYNCYGMTETSSALTCLAADETPGREASVGRAHPGVRLRIVDADGHELPTGERGEVCALGPNVITGYFEAPEIDAQRFFGSWLRTGDVGYLDQQGYLYLLDRVDDQINIDGEKFYPCQIEEVLASDPSVSEAVAIGVSHARKGQAVHAFVVAEVNRDVDVEVLRRRCLEQLPACAVPRRIMVLDQIPRNPTGKVLRRELASMPEP
ncbi:MAG: acyl--CoA ligase [Candidatus Omnitrophica bacterium]|nr:acyl--CoA ligase [Candidatus Omnitrophota bacterium]